MLTLRRKPRSINHIKVAAIDFFFNDEQVTLVLEEIHEGISIWSVFSTDWGEERYYPKRIALGNNQSLKINNWLKIYGSNITESGEAVIHVSADRNAKIERRDRVKNNDS